MGLTGVVDTSITDNVDLNKSAADLTGKKILVVGGTSGIGRGIAQGSAKAGATVVVVGRSFKDQEVANIAFEKADLSQMKEAKRIAETVDTDFDAVVFTQGIMAGPDKQTSSEGIELDNAISFLSRYTIIKYLSPRLASKPTRFFVMGFPGTVPVVPFNVDDLNADKSYKGGMEFVHGNTVIGNEALVVASSSSTEKGHTFYGLNPGVIKTDIRHNFYGNAFMRFLGSWVLEPLIGLFSVSAETYGRSITQLVFADNLERFNGRMFNPSCQVTLTSEAFRKDSDLAKKFMDAGAALIKEKAGV